MLDGMIVTVALPAIERDLGTSHADLHRRLGRLPSAESDR
jgi:hypothetical protein